MTEKKLVQNRGHFSDLDGVRGLLAFTVMLFHFGLNTILGRFIGISTADWGACVDFFFVLSGFVICKSITDRPVSMARFAKKRFWRLFPLHIAILVIFWSVLFGSGTLASDLVLNVSAFAPLLLRPMENFPAWSMGFEFYLPILFVPLFSGRKLGKPVILASMLMLFAVASIASYQLLSGETQYFGQLLDFTRAISGLGLGFVAWRMHESGMLKGLPRGNGFVFILIVLSFFVLVITSVRVPAVGLLLPLLILAAIFVGAHAKTFFSSRLMQWSGKLSFGIYMVHIPVLLAFTEYFGSDRLDGNVGLKGSMIVVSVGLATALHYLVERPGMRIGSKGFSALRPGFKPI